ncbi:heterokaryon incompatibility protein-domain-containing protein [Fusarium flagelliforme]|uniref:Vegetative incompatibility protein het-e-1 n=1 Tax=Fusarium flagelliforme TaxID=2675880 RepID=A0A395MCP4_9HYPO|nr:heterokaryon incompatibility protein-domain-containing protein [Fusarium flagelliforme]KAH7174390.1 heterokaryon incompatibility protein-domain-containing protein [Fusarium flagelliforme]RFN45606.1 vegetative incompatibility protein het-e-1 [Fusarium flagelliforme]
MRLINTTTLKLEEFQSHIPVYAILSHTWGDEEVSFVDWQDNLAITRTKAGFHKIERSCHQARADGYDYLWCDTNCIDKRSSSELSEAINSMFNWYKNSAVCYAHLSDVSPGDLSSFSNSLWFTRGWTLQELLAPSEEIFDITKIEEADMRSGIHKASISKRMSWVSHRQTSRPEDIAYCMLGIFDINMPLLYGEGDKAFIRLQEEIIRFSNDQSIFCWHWSREHVPSDWSSILSPSPKAFENSGSYHQAWGGDDSLSYTISNSGLSIKLKLVDVASMHNTWPSKNERPHGPKSARVLALLDVQCRDTSCRAAIALQQPPLSRRFVRSPFPPCPIPIDNCDNVEPTDICIVGPRDRALLIPAPPPTHITSPNFETLIVVSSPHNVKAVTTVPQVQHYFNTLALRPFTPTFFGAVFALTLTINPRMESITIFCFVGVDCEHYTTRWHCEILEALAPTHASCDVEKTVAVHESRIVRTVCRSIFSGRRLKSGMVDQLNTSPGEDFQIHAGPWVKSSDSSRLSVTHIKIPKLSSFRFYTRKESDDDIGKRKVITGLKSRELLQSRATV